MSESREEFADNIIFVDPKGVDTLDFDADEHRIVALANSGREAARTFLSAALDQEKREKPIEAMSLIELIRKEIAIKRIIRKQEKESNIPPREQPIFNDLIRVREAIEKKKGDLTAEEIDRMRAKEKARFRRIKEGMEGRITSTKALLNACQRKIDELDNLKKEFELRLKQVNFVRVGLGLRAVELDARFQAKEASLDGFKKQLIKIHALQKNILKIKQEITLLELRGTGLSAADKKSLKELKATYEELLSQKQNLFNKIIRHHQAENDDLMKHFFEELQKDCENVFFEVPTTSKAVKQRLRNEIRRCDLILKETENRIKRINSKKQILSERLQHFKSREGSAESYAALADLQNDLNKSIRYNTNVLGKILGYCVSEQPSLKKNVITFLLQTLSFLAFATKVGFSIGTFFPMLTYAIARFTKRFSNNPKAVATASRVIRAFHMPNLFKLNKLRALSTLTAQVLEKVNENYQNNADRSEHTYVYKLFAHYLKKSGLSLKDILPRRKNETKKQYLNRIKSVEDKLKITARSQRPGSHLPSAFTRNMEHFETDVLRASRHPKEQVEEEMRSKKSLIFRRNMDAIHLRYLQDMNKKFEKEKILTPTELLEYIHSAAAINVEIPAGLLDLFLSTIKEKLNPASGLRLSQEEFVVYLELERSLPGREVVNVRALLAKDEEYQLWLSNYESPKTKEEMERAWQLFFDFARKQPDPHPSQPEGPKPERHSPPPRRPSAKAS